MSKNTTLPSADQALPGRAQQMPIAAKHALLKTPMQSDFAGMEFLMVGMGCFWGAERLFWETPGVYSTAVGYAAGYTPNPTYQEVCTGLTGHNEVVRVIFDPQQISYEKLLKVFWENHNPTQGMQQGFDTGTQYRSGLYTYSPAQTQKAQLSFASFQTQLTKAGFGPITTELKKAPTFYFAEDYHQQYLHKNPQGYCGMGGTGVSCTRS